MSLLCIFFMACQPKKERKDIIPKNKMVNILVDIHLNESFIANERSLNKFRIQELVNTYYCDIFQKYEITEEEFSKSLDYYFVNLDEMKDVYEKVVAKLSEEYN